MIDKSTVLQIIGGLMKHPQYLSEVDKYQLDINDFYYKFDRYVFAAIDTLYRDGAKSINPIDVENFLESNAAASVIFKNNNGIEYLQDALFLSDENNFDYYYKRLKKINLLNQLQKNGIQTDEFYVEDLTKKNATEVNEKFEELDTESIIDSLKKKLLNIENKFVKSDSTETVDVAHNIEDIIASAREGDDIGIPLQGEIFNEVVAGARKGALYIRSASSGTGKTRQSVGDACYIAFPFRYEESKHSWVQYGAGKKTLVVATEQTIPEIQKMILAYLTGFNESKFRYGDFTPDEEKILRQALWVLNEYKENLYIVQMPSPSVSLIKNIVRQNVILHDIEYVFFDYIFICPSVLSEFKGYSLRNDKFLSYI